MASLETRNLTRRQAPRISFIAIVKYLLPKHDLSLVFTTPALAKKLNIATRKKDYVPNVLAYETEKNAGEILICLAEAKKQAPEYGMTYTQFVAYLFIHACLHLKGHPHGATMDKHERAAFARFAQVPFPTPHGPTNRNRNRYRNSSNEDRRR